MSNKSETESGIVYPEAIDVADKLRVLEMYGPNAETIRFLDSIRDAAMGVPPRNIEQKKSEPVGGKFFLILDETLMQYFRRPRSKKRRIRRKWRATAKELAEYMEADKCSVRPRLTEICQLGLAEATGERRHGEHEFRYVSLAEAESRRRAATEQESRQLTFA